MLPLFSRTALSKSPFVLSFWPLLKRQSVIFFSKNKIHSHHKKTMKTKTQHKKTMKTKSSLLIVALLMASLPASYAATSTWSGLGGDNNWNTAGNWNALPVPPSDNLIFTGTTQTTTNNNFAADSTFTGINFNNTSTGGSFTLAGNRISLVGHITTTGTTGSPTHTISLDMILANQQSPNIAAYNNVKISGNISETGGAKSISVAGGGDLTLTGNNTFSGNVSIPWARLFVNSLANSGTASAIGTGSGISLSSGGSGAALIYEGTLAGGHSTNRTITMEGTTGSATINANGAGPVTFNGILAVNNSANSKTLTLGGTSTAANTFASDISTGAGNVTVTKSGAGTWVLSGSNTYGGTTAINAGTLLINGDNSGAAGAVSVSSGATLGGNGTVGGATSLVSGALLSPGTSPGTLAFSSNLTLAGGVGVAGTTAIFEGGDLVTVAGTLTLTTDWNLTLTTGFQDGGTVTLFTYATAGGTRDLTPDFDITGLGFTPSSSLFLTNVSNSIVLNGISVVPEPSTWALLAVSLTTMMVLRRRRQS